jgi:hypothetical protein
MNSPWGNWGPGPYQGWYPPGPGYVYVPQPEKKQEEPSLTKMVKRAKKDKKAIEEWLKENDSKKKKPTGKDQPMSIIHQSMMLMMLAPFLGLLELYVIKQVLIALTK